MFQRFHTYPVLRLLSVATYLLKAVQGFQSHGIPIYAISIQVCSSLGGATSHDSPSPVERTPEYEPHLPYLQNLFFSRSPDWVGLKDPIEQLRVLEHQDLWARS